MLPCPRCKDMVDPEEYRFCPNCGTPIVLPQESAVQPVLREASGGAEFSAPQPQIQASAPQEMPQQARMPETPQTQQVSPPSPERFASAAPEKPSVPTTPEQPAQVNQDAISQQEPLYHRTPPQFPMNQQPVCRPMYDHPPVQKKRRGNGLAVTGLVFGATSLTITLFVLVVLLSGAAVPEGTLPFLIALAGPGEVLGIVSVCRKTPKKILGVLSLSFAAAAHLICITANMISRL